jgi:hypothetical protein
MACSCHFAKLSLPESLTTNSVSLLLVHVRWGYDARQDRRLPCGRTGCNSSPTVQLQSKRYAVTIKYRCVFNTEADAICLSSEAVCSVDQYEWAAAPLNVAAVIHLVHGFSCTCIRIALCYLLLRCILHTVEGGMVESFESAAKVWFRFALLQYMMHRLSVHIRESGCA